MNTAVARREAVHPIVATLEDRSEALAALLPSREAVERFKRVVLQSVNRNPDLRDCSPDSLADAAMEAARLGLEPSGAIGGAHLVKYGNKAQLIVDYRGLLQLARRSGEIAKVTARLVHAGDTFEVRYGSAEGVVHVPDLAARGAPVTHVYAIARLTSGEEHFEVMSAEEIEAIRARSRAGNAGPWRTDWGEMAKKTVLRRLTKLLPLSIEARAVIEHEDAFERAPAVTVTSSVPLHDRLSARREALALPSRAEEGSSGPSSAPAPEQPAGSEQDGQEASAAPATTSRPAPCAHQATEATAKGVVCTECGVLLAERAAGASARPARRRAAPKKPGDPGYGTALAHGMADKRGISHDELRHVAAAVAGVSPRAVPSWSAAGLTEEQWVAVGDVLEAAVPEGAPDTSEAAQEWVWRLIDAQLDDDEEVKAAALGRLIAEQFNKKADALSVGEWLGVGVKVRDGALA